VNAPDQLALLSASVVDFHVRAELLGKLERSLKSGKPLIVKAGFDPTSPDLHLGHTVVLQQMRRFQDLGHTAVLVVGDFTALIGDPTGKSQTRPQLSEEQVRANAATYQAQAFRVLDAARTVVRFNSEWLAPLGTVGLIELAAKYPLARMMERDDFKRRWEEGRSISLHELLYPLLQGQDSVVLKADVELGGTDQLFNLLVGRTLMREGGQEPQVVMTTPILEGLEARLVNGLLQGEKMSKSLGNYVGITEAPREMFGKLMSISDDLMWRFYALLASGTPEALAELKESVRKGTLHPKQAKVNLALELVGRFHSKSEAQAAADEFEKVFAKGALPEEIDERTLDLEEAQMALVRVLVLAGLATSNTDARRLITQGGVTIDQERCNDPQRSLGAGRYLLRVGKRRIAYVTLRAPGL